VYDYVWNVKGQLVEFKKDGITKATYTYDPLGRRISKTANGATTYFHYNNWVLCGEYGIAVNGNVNEHHSYGYSPASGSPLFIKQGGEYYYCLNDHLGTPQKIISVSGRVVWSAVYGAFGEAAVGIGAEIENNIRFPGQYFDSESGIHYNFFRYYDPETGRYISKDPIGIKGGLNLYAYCGSDAINGTDRFGLETYRLSEIKVAVEEIEKEVSKTKCCCTSKQNASLSLDMNSVISGESVTSTLTIKKVGCIEQIVATYWWDCVTAQSDAPDSAKWKYDKDGNKIALDDWQDYGWSKGGDTHTDNHRGKRIKPDPTDQRHWGWAVGVIYTYCGKDNRRHANWAETGVDFEWTTEGGGTWIDPRK
jgi:RHS repeat-associated protein